MHEQNDVYHHDHERPGQPEGSVVTPVMRLNEDSRPYDWEVDGL